MFDFYVSSDQAVLELDDDPLIGYLRIHNNPNNPTDVIYCVLPLPQKDMQFFWHSTTVLTGPAADLVILTQNLNQKDISIEDADFRQFRSVIVSDNKFYRDGDRFLVIQEDEHKSHSITFKNCQALSADFFCNKLTWIGGRVKNNLSVELHGLNTELIIKGNDDIIQGSDNTRAVIGTLIIAENIKPLRVCLENVAIITNFSCEGVKSLSLRNVKSGSGICKLIAEEIEELSNFQNLSTEFIVKSEIANIGSFISPIGKVYIDVCSFIEFTTDGDGRFQGLDLNIDVSQAIEKKIQMPYGIVKFDKILIKGASNIDIPGSLIAEQVEIINCLQLNLDESRIGHLKYQTAKGEVFFGKHSAKPTKIDSLWLIGNIKANFQGPTDLFDLDSEGRCHITIFDNYQGKIIKLNLNLDAQRDNINAERDGYFGLHIQNAGNKKVDIEAILAKLNSFNVSGSVKLGQVICQPIDRRYNLIQINVKYLSNISIDGFFAGFDHNIVIEKATGKISLVQSMDRALTTSQIFASVNCAMQDFLTIRAGQGLSFHGNIKIVDGSIELYTLFGVLSARGSLTAKQIKLLAIEGSLDISATLDAYSLVTYAKTESYIHDTILNAIQFLAQTVGHYIQARSNVNTSKTVIISESSDIMLIASRMQSTILEVTSTRDLRVDESSMRATDQAYRGNNVYVTDSNISGQSSSFQSQQDIGIDSSNIIGEQTTHQASKDIRVGKSNIQVTNQAYRGDNIHVTDSNISEQSSSFQSQQDIGIDSSNIIGEQTTHQASKDIRVGKSNIQVTDQAYRGDNVYVTDSNISGQSSSFQSQKDIGIVRSSIIDEQITNQAGRDLRVTDSNLAGRKIGNVVGGDISVSDSRIVSRLLVNQAEGNVNISGSKIFSSQMFTDSQKNITIDGSQILSDNNLFFKSIANFLAISSDIALSQFPTNLFLYNSNARDINGNPLVRCGFQFKEIEALGILDSRGHVDKSFSELQYHLVNSSKIDLSIFQAIAEQNPHSIIIDAHTGVIIGSRLSAKDHQVIIRTKNGLELLPLTLYNATMFGGGFNDTGIRSVISKIEAGAITIDAGSYLKSVGALLRASVGSLKADYIMDQSFINEYRVRHASLQALEPWLSSPELYDMVVNDQIVPTRLEFSEITKIDLGKGKINLFYPYSSKQVHLRQREGDLNIDRDVHFPYEVMAIHVDSGRIFFGIPKVEHFIINLFGGWFGNKGQIHLQHHTTEHVHVTGQNLFFGASGDIEVHGKIQASGALGLKSGGDIKLLADKHNFGSTVKQSILKAENAYMMANNIEVIGSLMVIKDHFQIVSHNDIKLLPIALMTSYSYHGEKMTSKEYAIKHVVSEINAGVLNIDAGRAVEFISSLIEAEEINLHAKELNIKHAKDIFDKQMEFKGAKKWYGGGRNSWSSYDHTETVLPTVIYADRMKILIDQDATVETAQIFAQQDILMQVGGNLTVKDGYNLHIHDYQKKSYSLLSFHQGSMKIHTNKNIKDFHENYTSGSTIICAGGTFYGIVDGTMHILGSKIIGHDIHIAVPNGLKLEASKYTDKSLIFVSESGIKSGYYLKGNQEVGVRAGASFDDEQQKMWQRHIESSELTAANSVTIMVKDGTFEQISSHIAAKIITVEARNWLAKTYDAQIISDHIKQHVEGGVKIAVKQTVTNSLDKIKMLVNKKGSHIIDQLDRAFKAYDIYKSLAALPTNAVTGGLYAYLEASQLEQMSSTSIAVDNTISGEVIMAHVTNDIRFQGVQMTAKDVDFTAANFTFETSRDQCDYQYDFSSVNIEIDLNNAINSNLAASTRSVESSSTIHHANYIKASGNLKITLSGDGKFKGVSLEGANVDIQANNLILESVHVWTSCKMQEKNNVNSKKANAVMYPAYS